jgi:hypothetical protein
LAKAAYWAPAWQGVAHTVHGADRHRDCMASMYMAPCSSCTTVAASTTALMYSLQWNPVNAPLLWQTTWGQSGLGWAPLRYCTALHTACAIATKSTTGPTNQVLVLSGWKQPGHMVCEGFSGRYLQNQHSNLDNTSTYHCREGSNTQLGSPLLLNPTPVTPTSSE